MSVEAKHSYRFGYLKSEEWQTVRLEALVRFGATCCICGFENISNDAHHIRYPKNVYKTKVEDLVILCRGCHNFIHALMRMTTIKGDGGVKDFGAVLKAISIWRKEIQPQKSEEISPKKLAVLSGKFPGFQFVVRKVKIKSKPVCICCHHATEIKERSFVFNKHTHVQKWCDDCWKDFEQRKINNWKSLHLLWDERRKQKKS